MTAVGTGREQSWVHSPWHCPHAEAEPAAHAGTSALWLLVNAETSWTLCIPCDHPQLPLLQHKRLVLPFNKTSSLALQAAAEDPPLQFQHRGDGQARHGQGTLPFPSNTS